MRQLLHYTLSFPVAALNLRFRLKMHQAIRKLCIGRKSITLPGPGAMPISRYVKRQSVLDEVLKSFFKVAEKFLLGYLQGDHSSCAKPPVDTEINVVF